jgi:hypothetical protein
LVKVRVRFRLGLGFSKKIEE